MQDKVQCRFLLNVVVSQSPPTFKLLPCKDQSLHYAQILENKKKKIIAKWGLSIHIDRRILTGLIKCMCMRNVLSFLLLRRCMSMISKLNFRKRILNTLIEKIHLV